MDPDRRTPVKVIEDYTAAVQRTTVLDFCIWLREQGFYLLNDGQDAYYPLTEARVRFLSEYVKKGEAG